MLDERTCATCFWWQRSAPKLANAKRDPSARTDVGICQLRAPVVVQVSGGFAVSLYPETHESRFCADWKERPPTTGQVLPFNPKGAA